MFRTTSTVITAILGSFISVRAGVVVKVAPPIGTGISSVQGTYWRGATFAGACLLQDYKQPENMEYVAINKDVNGHGQYCGSCISITASPPNNKPPVVAIVSSYCNDCPSAALDMPGSLFDAIMGNKTGRPGIGKFDWQVVPCKFDHEKPAIVNKQGSSKWHLSMLVADSKFPIASVVITSGGKTMATTKMNYNYWEIPNQPTLSDRVDVKVTCVNGGSFSVHNVDPSSMTPTVATGGCGGQGE